MCWKWPVSPVAAAHRGATKYGVPTVRVYGSMDPFYVAPPKNQKKMLGARRSRSSGAPAHSLDEGAEAVAKKQKRKGEKRAAVLAKGWAVVDKKRQSLKLKQNLGAAPMAAILKFSVRPSATAIFFAFFCREYLQ